MPLSELVLVVMGLLTVAMLAAGICRNLPVPYTVFLVILGLLLGGMARSWPQFENLQAFQLTPELVLFLFLPALIFESAFNLDGRQLLKDIGPILCQAVPALLISTGLIGAGLWLLIDLDITLALLFGALISATDPVAVVALFKELGAPQRLNVLVEGESLLNDATAIVLFNIILGILLTGSFVVADLGGAVLDFLRVFIGGACVGAITGVVISEVLHRMKAGLSAYMVMSVVLAYASFALAEHELHVSGVMAVLSAAICLGIFGVSRVPQEDIHTIMETWEVLALVCNSLLFLLVGLSVDIAALTERGEIILVAVFLVLLARAATVYTMVPATVKIFNLPKITMGERHIMWWGGLKGGLAIAIVLSIPAEVAGRDMLLDMTLGVVLFSLLVNAPTIRPLMHRLGIDRLTEDEKDDLRHGLYNAEKEATEILGKLQRAELISRSTRQLIEKKNQQVFATQSGIATAGQDTRHLVILALKAELEELKHFYDIGLIEQYIYLDLKNTLQRDRERWLNSEETGKAPGRVDKPSIFKRTEFALIKRMREHDWATGILSRYQYLRFAQSLQRDMVGVMIAAAALDALEQQEGHDEKQVQSIIKIYSERLQHRREKLKSVAHEFPEFYLRFETRLFAKVAMLAAKHYNEVENHHGGIGQKAFVHIERRINEALGALPAISNPAPRLAPGDLIATVPLLNGLSNATIERLAQKAKPVTFIANDIIIGEGERGDALYIISHGWVKVTRHADEQHPVAELRDGDFFGEIALLGDHMRTATVKAVTTSTLLRLGRKDVIALAEKDHELKNRLEEARQQREEDNS